MTRYFSCQNGNKIKKIVIFAKKRNMKNILCFEGEWLFNDDKKKNRFSLNTEPVLRMLQEYYKCETTYRHILSKEDLQHYINFFNSHKREWNKIGIIYIACHGWFHSLSLEGEDGNVDLKELADMAGDFFRDKIVHFSCCKTLANTQEVEQFKNITGARLVCGYKKNVDAMKSAIADVALLNELITSNKPGNIKNEEVSTFRKTYKSLLDDLRFDVV